jgi:hypothetical protein
VILIIQSKVIDSGDSYNISGFIEKPVLNISGRIIMSVSTVVEDIIFSRLRKLAFLSCHIISGWIIDNFMFLD